MPLRAEHCVERPQGDPCRVKCASCGSCIGCLEPSHLRSRARVLSSSLGAVGCGAKVTLMTPRGPGREQAVQSEVAVCRRASTHRMSPARCQRGGGWWCTEICPPSGESPQGPWLATTGRPSLPSMDTLSTGVFHRQPVLLKSPALILRGLGQQSRGLTAPSQAWRAEWSMEQSIVTGPSGIPGQQPAAEAKPGRPGGAAEGSAVSVTSGRCDVLLMARLWLRQLQALRCFHCCLSVLAHVDLFSGSALGFLYCPQLGR